MDLGPLDRMAHRTHSVSLKIEPSPAHFSGTGKDFQNHATV